MLLTLDCTIGVEIESEGRFVDRQCRGLGILSYTYNSLALQVGCFPAPRRPGLGPTLEKEEIMESRTEKQ